MLAASGSPIPSSRPHTPKAMIATFRCLRPISLTFGAALLLAAPLRAQDSTLAVTPATTTPAQVTPAAGGPTVETASVAVRRPATESKTVAMAPANQGQGQATALMIVGGAAVLTGIIVGGGAGYAISVGGAVIGLIGLYQYLQ
jgi:hypothetical protein